MTSEEEVYKALNSENPDQRRIAETGLSLVATLLRKNSDYGSSAWKPPRLKPSLSAGDAILVRMSDKVERISNLSTSEARVDESIDDTITDLAGYAMLWLARPADC